MEGRRPPPKAEHPFPNNPDMTKFWGPLSRAMFRSFAVVMGCFLTLGGINMYLTRHEKGPFGMDLSLSAEDIKKRQEIMNATGMFKYPDLKGIVSFQQRDKHISWGGIDMTFDDGVKFDIPDVEPPKGDRYYQ